ncbi:MAG: hypothetical protein GY679_03915 [Mycoplasma sp.]|nr:hypothetical protein [Mycoplasma sp.]
MKKHETIPFYILLIRTLAKDFEKENITWEELYNKLFIKDTDIYREFVVTLVDSGIELSSKVQYKEAVQITNVFTTIFHEYEEERLLINIEKEEEFKIPKSTTLKATLAKIGYILI